jgi:hypothetical protein
MSPLLYQLSYTASAAKLTTYGDRVKRNTRAVPFAMFQKPFRLFLFDRPGAFPNRATATIVFDPEHLASFIDHPRRILLS